MTSLNVSKAVSHQQQPADRASKKKNNKILSLSLLLFFSFYYLLPALIHMTILHLYFQKEEEGRKIKNRQE
jgi:hypothetical protein